MDTIISKRKYEEPKKGEESKKVEEAKNGEEPKKAEEPVKSDKPMKRAGHNNTQTILTAAGSSMVGAAAGSAGTMAYMNEDPLNIFNKNNDDDEEEEEEEEEGKENENENGNDEDGKLTEGGEEEEEEKIEPDDWNNGNDFNDGGEEIEPEDWNEGNDFTDGGEEIEPEDWNDGSNLTDGGNGLTDGGNEVEPENWNNEGNGGDIAIENEGNNVDNVLPDDIAQELMSEVDDNDRDINSVFDVSSIETRYDEMGNEMQVAMIHTPDGGQFMMVDIDNDFTFDAITDMAGNPVGQVEGGLTMSDVEEMLDDSGGYLAPEEEVSLASNDINEVDVVNTDGTGTDLAALDVNDFNNNGFDDPLLADAGFESIDSNDNFDDIDQGLV